MKTSVKILVSVGLLIFGMWMYAITDVYAPHHDESRTGENNQGV